MNWAGKRAKKMAEENPEPKKIALYTHTLTPEQSAKLHAILKKGVWIDRVVEHAAYAYEGNKVQVVVYKSGKLVVQGKMTQDFVENILEPQVTGVASLGYEEIHHPEWFELHAGCDEAGKGDVFGPLVTACVIAGGDKIKELQAAGVRDSKKISDAEILKIEKTIREMEKSGGIAVTSAQCSMEKYNELMSKPGANLNHLLSWLHSRSLGDALDKKNAPWGLLDQFSTNDRVETYLNRRDFELRRRTKAESDPVVAAASIVARAGFLRGMKKLSEEAGIKLMKGASNIAQQQFKMLKEKVGAEGMKKFAKLHFKLKSLA